MQSGSNSFQVHWTQTAQNQVQAVFDYLSENWTDTQCQQLATALDNVLLNLQNNPKIYQQSDFTFDFPVHRAVVLKLNSLIYAIDETNRQVTVLAFIDNRQNPFSITDLLT